MTELLPCSKCRRVPEWHTKFFRRGQRDEAAWPMIVCPECKPHGHFVGVAEPTRDACVSAWNRLYGSPLTLAERPQDVPAWHDEPSVGDGVRVVPSAASCVERGRSCEDALARWSVGACSGGVR